MSLRDELPQLAAQWHPTLNGKQTPSQIARGSKLRAHWLCPECGHVWQARVSSRATGHGCPACARLKTGRAKSRPGPGDSLADRFPEIAAEWHPTRNGDLGPSTVGYASNKKVWWQCSVCSHEWEIQVANRSRGHSCKRCATAKLRKPKPGNSLVERCPIVAAEWHPTRNGSLTPADVAFSSKQKPWWRCPTCDHEWQAAVGNRANGAGCPECKRRTMRLPIAQRTPAREAPRRKPEQRDRIDANSLSTRCPKVAAQWHPTKNSDLSPAGLRWGSNMRVWWLCPACGHEWQAIIASRTRLGTGCPKCSRKRAGAALAMPKPGQSLAEQNPDLAAQWHPTRNGDLSPAEVSTRSGKRVWWQCPDCGIEWDATIGSRTNGSGCKACATQRSAIDLSKPKPGQSLAEQDSELAAQWHPTLNGALTPFDVTRNSGRKAWWLCSRGHEWNAMINNRTKARGCPKCKLWGTSVEEIRLRHELVASGVPIELDHKIPHPTTKRPMHCDMVVPAWKVVIEFDGNRFHKTDESHVKDQRKTAALTEAGWTVIRVREELTPIGPHDVVVPLLSSEIVRAKAVLGALRTVGHEVLRYSDYLATEDPWAAAAANDEVRRPRTKSLASQRPSLAAEWDYVKNSPITPDDVTIGSGQRAWWLCPVCAHSWEAVIGSRATGHGCPTCGREASLRARSRPRPGHSLVERCPVIAAEWHPTRNGDVTPRDVSFATRKTAWWACSVCGNDWQGTIAKRTSRNTGCPRGCHRRKTNSGRWG